MAGVKTALKSGLVSAAEPLICVGLKSVLNVPVEGAIAWVKQRFTDHSQMLPKAIAAANDRAWQAVALALAGDKLFDTIKNLFRDSDLNAVRKQIRAFVADADTGLESSPDGLRMRACDELNRLKRDGRLGTDDVELTSLDLTRFTSTAKISDDAHRAVAAIADDLKADAPHLAQVLMLAPPGGGTPLLAAAFAFFLRRQIATNAELSRELTHDGLRLLSQTQQAGFENLEQSLSSKWSELFETLGGWFATTDAELADINAKLEQLLEQNAVSKKAESPLRVSVTSDGELLRLKTLRDRLRNIPVELVDAELHSLFGDGLAAAGQFAEAQRAHAAAASAAKDSADRIAEAEAAYKQFKDACELQQWEPALAALNRAIALDEKRFRPVPKHFLIESILGAGAFGVVFKCRNTISYDEDDNELILAVKTFREADLDRPLKDIFGEANTLKNLTHENIIRVIEHGYADPETQQRPFLAMEYFPGVTLEDYLKQHGKLNVENFLAVFSQIAAALHKAHTGRRPIFHRDLKPANIMVRKDGEVWIVKVIDFGLAVRSAVRSSSLSIPHALRATRDKSITGTIKYAAPEQLGEKPYPVGPHSDVFAFGKTALEGLFGTVQPTPRHWKLLPEHLADLLARCVEEEFHGATPDDGRYHGFAPILDKLAPPPLVAPATPIPTEPILTLVAVPPPPPAKPPALKAGDRLEIPLPGGTKMAFAYCPPGSFMMGSPETESERNPVETQHKVTLSNGFYMGIHPVTRGHFADFIVKSNHKTDAETSGGGYVWTGKEWKLDPACNWRKPGFVQTDDHPVCVVSYNDAVAFTKWLTNQPNPPQSIRLPSEAEWEYAARGGTSTPYYFGSLLNGEQANCNGNYPYGTTTKGPYLEKTTAVGTYAKKFPHPWGVTDLHGNVWEWCADWYDAKFYERSPEVDPMCSDSVQKYRALRGGSWSNDATRCRAARRNWNEPARRNGFVGFRVCFSLGR